MVICLFNDQSVAKDFPHSLQGNSFPDELSSKPKIEQHKFIEMKMQIIFNNTTWSLLIFMACGEAIEQLDTF